MNRPMLPLNPAASGLLGLYLSIARERRSSPSSRRSAPRLKATIIPTNIYRPPRPKEARSKRNLQGHALAPSRVGCNDPLRADWARGTCNLSQDFHDYRQPTRGRHKSTLGINSLWAPSSPTPSCPRSCDDPGRAVPVLETVLRPHACRSLAQLPTTGAPRARRPSEILPQPTATAIAGLCPWP